MKWKPFFEKAHPASMAEAESKRSVVWKISRWLGIRFAYVFYHLGFSANLLSIFRCILALTGFYLLSLITTGNKWAPVLGAFLLAWQIILDYADGPIARVQGKSSELGEKMDGLANAFSRPLFIILAGFLTRSPILFLISIFSAYVVTVFIPESNVKIKTSGLWRPVALIYRISLYVPVMVFGLPLLIGIHGILGFSIVIFSYIVVCFYTALASLWLFLCL